MKFGLLYLTDYHPEVHGTYTTYYEQMLEQIVTAESLGFDGVWFAEHRIPRFAFGNPAVFMAAVARMTSRIRLGTGVDAPPRSRHSQHPWVRGDSCLRRNAPLGRM